MDTPLVYRRPPAFRAWGAVAGLFLVALVCCTEANPSYRGRSTSDDGPRIDGAVEAGPVSPDDVRPADVVRPAEALPPAEDGRPTEDLRVAEDHRPTDDSRPSDTTAPSGPVELERGLLGHWPFDEGTGVFAYNRINRQSHLGVLANATWVQPGYTAAFANPSCVEIDDALDLVQVDARELPRVGTPISLSIWMWLAPGNVGRRVIFGYGPSNQTQGIETGFIDLAPAVWISTADDVIQTRAKLVGQRWYHVAYTFDGTLHRLFLDGEELGSSLAPSPSSTPVTLRLAHTNAVASGMVGRMDDLRLYNRALNAAEVAALSARR
jgi:Concanavalin A-like lectin/glucanases superfamily